MRQAMISGNCKDLQKYHSVVDQKNADQLAESGSFRFELIIKCPFWFCLHIKQQNRVAHFNKNSTELSALARRRLIFG